VLYEANGGVLCIGGEYLWLPPAVYMIVWNASDEVLRLDSSGEAKKKGIGQLSGVLGCGVASGGPLLGRTLLSAGDLHPNIEDRRSSPLLSIFLSLIESSARFPTEVSNKIYRSVPASRI
jgi:hypothetical protein